MGCDINWGFVSIRDLEVEHSATSIRIGKRLLLVTKGLLQLAVFLKATQTITNIALS